MNSVISEDAIHLLSLEYKTLMVYTLNKPRVGLVPVVPVVSRQDTNGQGRFLRQLDDLGELSVELTSGQWTAISCVSIEGEYLPQKLKTFSNLLFCSLIFSFS